MGRNVEEGADNVFGLAHAVAGVQRVSGVLGERERYADGTEASDRDVLRRVDAEVLFRGGYRERGGEEGGRG